MAGSLHGAPAAGTARASANDPALRGHASERVLVPAAPLFVRGGLTSLPESSHLQSPE